MKSFMKWALVVCFPAVGFSNMLAKASKEDNKKTVTQFIDAVPKIAKTASIAFNVFLICLSIAGFLYVKNKFFGGRRAFR